MPTAGPTVRNVGRLRVYVEPAGSANFAIDHTGTLGDFTDIPMVEQSFGQLTLTQEVLDPGSLVQNQLDYRLEILGKKSWSLTFDIPIAATGTVAGDGVTAVEGPVGLLLKTLWGGVDLGTGTTVNGTWASASVGNVASSGGLAEGGAILIADSNGELHAREIETITGAAVTVKDAFPFQPTDGSTVYAAATYYPVQDPDTSLQFIVEGLEGNDRWVLLGGQGTVTLSTPTDGQIQTMTVTVSGPRWLEGDDAAGSGSLEGSDLGSATYANHAPISSETGRMRAHTVGNALSGVEIPISAVSFEPQLAYTPVPSPSGVEGVLRHRLTRQNGPALTGSFTKYLEDRTWFGHRDARTALSMAYQNGADTGGVVFITAPTVQVTDVQTVDAGGIQSEQVSFKARLDAETTSSGDLADAPFRLHIAC
jgi:hypothetical protein